MSGEDECKLFVAGLADTVTEEALRQVFEASGATVADLTIPSDRATGRSRGFGFVTMETAEHAAQARAELDGKLLDGRPMSVRAFRGERPERASARPPVPPVEDATLYVGNLPFTATAEDVIREFGAAGFADIARVHLPLDADGRARGFGFVSMRTAAEARRAADELAGLDMGGRNLSVSVARARGTQPEGSSPAPSLKAPRSYNPGESRGYTGESSRPSTPRESSGPRSMPSGAIFDAVVVPNSRGGDERRSRGAQAPDRAERKKDKKRKGKGSSQDRGGRRGGEGFSSSRPSDYVDAWDDDD